MAGEWVAPPYDVGSGSRAVPSNITVSGTVATDETAPTGILNGSVTVTTAATRVQVSGSSVPCDTVYVKAKAANAGKVYVGNATVAAANGLELSPGEGIYITIDNLNRLYVDAATNGDKITYLGS